MVASIPTGPGGRDGWRWRITDDGGNLLLRALAGQESPLVRAGGLRLQGTSTGGHSRPGGSLAAGGDHFAILGREALRKHPGTAYHTRKFSYEGLDGQGSGLPRSELFPLLEPCVSHLDKQVPWIDPDGVDQFSTSELQ